MNECFYNSEYYQIFTSFNTRVDFLTIVDLVKTNLLKSKIHVKSEVVIAGIKCFFFNETRNNYEEVIFSHDKEKKRVSVVFRCSPDTKRIIEGIIAKNSKVSPRCDIFSQKPMFNTLKKTIFVNNNQKQEVITKKIVKKWGKKIDRSKSLFSYDNVVKVSCELIIPCIQSVIILLNVIIILSNASIKIADRCLVHIIKVKKDK